MSPGDGDEIHASTLKLSAPYIHISAILADIIYYTFLG